MSRHTQDTDPKEPFFGSNAIPWVLSLAFAIGVMWLLKIYALPFLQPYNEAISAYIVKMLGL